ncbi:MULTISPECIES: dihydropteroate synthase [Moraxella]|uniref:Dihydropteroate synthase n=1 Tax=Moraxella lacunata TaxID=477 RepID=A0A1B8PWA7_MORLA|nr:MULTISPECIES: dihydropteroate synthase [Moraxella]MBE9577738.1 dihydropteroate synthase [Moraxella sp. K1664]MBE9587160.1 dihydropteroate synthase [Moraxella sp. K1630]MBE9595444.1 dihydropteroate synthase [Moraxella sp. K2450]MDH9217903.1 dihydropteroate synthase [Moraxella lacunata]MDI4483308.1 dihydropteroate synthase [Moraxella lacunata]
MNTLFFNNKTLSLSTPKIMGVLNVTPDSFSDGGRFNSIDTALRHADEMIRWGVDIIDIGGESTRPNAPSVATDTELDRVIPVVEALRAEFGKDVWLSLDTSSPAVMEQGVRAGADMVNDVRGLRRDGVCDVVARLDCPVVIMHSRGEPDTMTQTMNSLANYDDVVREVISELDRDIQNALNAGVRRENIVIDVGMGFAKNHAHHITLMQHLDTIIAHFGLPMLFGVSRKRFLGEILSTFVPAQDHAPTDRDVIGTVAHLFAIQKGASIVRVHDVAHMAQAIKMWQMLK